MASRSRISDFMHKAMPKWALGEGDVDGSRPVILNETIAKQYGMGSPTTFLTLEYGWDRPKHKRSNYTGSDKSNPASRIKTRHGYYILSNTGEFSLGKLEDKHVNTVEASGSSDTRKAVGETTFPGRPQPMNGRDPLFGIGSWVILPTLAEDDGYESGHERGDGVSAPLRLMRQLRGNIVQALEQVAVSADRKESEEWDTTEDEGFSAISTATGPVDTSQLLGSNAALTVAGTANNENTGSHSGGFREAWTSQTPSFLFHGQSTTPSVISSTGSGIRARIRRAPQPGNEGASLTCRSWRSIGSPPGHSCDQMFESESRLFEHERERHNQFYCIKCLAKFLTESDWQSHRSQLPHHCSKCSTCLVDKESKKPKNHGCNPSNQGPQSREDAWQMRYTQDYPDGIVHNPNYGPDHPSAINAMRRRREVENTLENLTRPTLNPLEIHNPIPYVPPFSRNNMALDGDGPSTPPSLDNYNPVQPFSDDAMEPIVDPPWQSIDSRVNIDNNPLIFNQPQQCNHQNLLQMISEKDPEIIQLKQRIDSLEEQNSFLWEEILKARKKELKRKPLNQEISTTDLKRPRKQAEDCSGKSIFHCSPWLPSTERGIASCLNQLEPESASMPSSKSSSFDDMPDGNVPRLDPVDDESDVLVKHSSGVYYEAIASDALFLGLVNWPNDS